MRKPRDIDAELKALGEKQKQLRSKRTVQLGELVAATGADALDLDVLTGVLLDAVERTSKHSDQKEAWRRKGESFFRRERRAKADGSKPNDTASPASEPLGEPDGSASRHRHAAPD